MADDVFGEDVNLNEVENPEGDVQESDVSTEREQEAVPEQEVKAEIKEEKTVPLAALLEERNDWKAKYAELEAKLSKGNERVEKLYEALNKPEAQAPEYEQDPLGHLRHSKDLAEKEVQEMKKWRENLENSQKAQNEFAAFQQRVNNSEAKFAESNPDYWEAAQFVAKAKRDELEELGIPNEQINSVLQNQLVALTATALRGQKDPAQVIYALAKKSGFAKKQNIETLQKGVSASKSVPSGRTVDKSLSIESLAGMSDDDFDKIIDDPKAWKGLGA